MSRSKCLLQILVYGWLGLLSAPVAASPSHSEFEMVSFIEQLAAKDIMVRSQKASVDEARAFRIRALGNYLPQVLLSAKDLQSRENHVRDPGISYRQKSAQVGLEWNLFRFGADGALYSQAQRELEASELKARQAVVDAESELALLISEYLYTLEILKIKESLLGGKKRLAEIYQQRYKLGLVSKQEFLKAEIESENSQIQVDDGKKQLQLRMGSLKERQVATDPHWKWPFAESLKKAVWSEFEKMTIENSISYQVVKKIEDSRQSQLSFARRKFGPAIDLFIEKGFVDWRSDQEFWSTRLSLTVPLFSAPLIADYQKASAEKNQAEIQKINDELKTTPRLSVLLENLKTIQKSMDRRQKTWALSEQLAVDNERRLRLGRSSVNDLIVDQNRVAESGALLAEGLREYHEQFFKLCKIVSLPLRECLALLGH